MATRKRAGQHSSKRAGFKLYELHVELEDITPPVWRRLIVPGDMTLPELHRLLQLVMGWTDSHLHSFTFGKTTYSIGSVDDLEELDMLDERRVTLESALATSVKTFVYEYDFGDSWRHLIAWKPVAKPNPERSYPLCTGGARSAPPEDCGGTGGYENFLEAIRDPRHEEHDSFLTWIGGAFDPEAFDLNAINRMLRIGPPPESWIPRTRHLD
jgi:hypothetical protein